MQCRPRGGLSQVASGPGILAAVAELRLLFSLRIVRVDAPSVGGEGEARLQFRRISSERRARIFDGGYGLASNGRWNTRGRPVTYCATVPSLCALEKRVHVADAALLPPQVMVCYDVPDALAQRRIEISDLPPDWPAREVETQALGDAWLDGAEEALLIVPSVIVPLGAAPDRNVLVNHRAQGIDLIRIVDIRPFTLDPRLFAAG